MKGKDIEVEIKEETQEEIAKKVIEDIHKIIKNRKEELKEAEDKLGEVLEKDVEDIEEKDSRHYDW